MSKSRAGSAKDGKENISFAEGAVESAVASALNLGDEKPVEKDVLTPVDDEQADIGAPVPIDDEQTNGGASAPALNGAATTRSAEEEALQNAEQKPENFAAAVSAGDKRDRQSQRTANKEQKDRQKAKKRAALKKLNAIKKQIKKGELPLSPSEQSQNDMSFYGERLPYPGGFPVYCCKYVIITDGKRKLAMRFFNASDILVTGLRFTLTEKDANGDVLDVRKQERTGLFAERGTEFGVADADVSRGCVSVEIRVEMIKSDMYEYVIDDAGGVELRYGDSDPTSDFYFKNKPSCSVKKRGKWYVVFAVLVVACVTAVVVGFSVRMGILNKVRRNTVDTESAIIYQISGGDLYVEA